jgi:CRISPR/Cas system-associated exonuclease Cas4 (RecB family)
MSATMPAWSYSSLTAFETCPRRYYLTKVKREVVEPPTEATTWGNEVHKAFEDAVLKQQPLPPKMEEWQPIAMKLQSAKGKRSAELQLSITKSFTPTTWKAKDAWCRGIVDVVVENDTKALALDYKTGKRKPDSTQLMLFAALLMHNKQYLEAVTTGFVWLKEKAIDKAKYTRDDVGMIWQEFMPRVARMEKAYEQDKWVPKPSGLCAKWCPVSNKQCEFSGRR